LLKLTASRRARMTSHPKAKLGLAGRLALVQQIERGQTLKAAAAALQRVAGDGAQVVASLDARPR
jgi:hypothetical protein